MFGFGKRQESYGLQIVEKQAKIVAVSKAANQYNVIHKHTIQLDKGMIINGKIQDEEAVANRIGTVVRQCRIQGAKVNLAVPTSNVILRKTAFPSFKDKELRNMIDVDLHGGAQLPFKNPVFDYMRLGQTYQKLNALNEGDASAKKLKVQEEVLIFATPLDLVESYSRVAFLAGLTPHTAELAPLALFRLMLGNLKLTRESLAQSFIMLNLESNHTDLMIFFEGIPIFVRTIQINNSFMLDAGSDPMEAYGKSLSMELGRVLNYYKFSVSEHQEDIKHIYISGEKESVDSLSNQLQNDFEGQIMPLSFDSIIQGFNTTIDNSYAVAVGLALKGA
jgi:type IV pilus assembly protein PilM